MLSTRPIDDQVALLMRGVTFGDPQIETVMAAELRTRLAQALAEDRPLRVYLGVDPTSSDLHLGHTVPLRKLRQFQDLGHEVIFLIGSFTALIGDPSDKDSARAQQTTRRSRPASTFVAQVHRVLDPGAPHRVQSSLAGAAHLCVSSTGEPFHVQLFRLAETLATLRQG
jgi:tyrosyl-tRNA synthetase